ncbi:hypothetical protein N6H14_15780 [Paenibacillus sp. CC-CFT747]|nr:hypothetical protein N6H14_15780 [Paenibacillus sp. CC-CFT747]
MKYRFLERGRLLRFEELGLSRLKDSGSSSSAFPDLEASLRTGDEERLQTQLTGVIEEVRTGGYTVDYSKSILLDLLLHFHRCLKTAGFHPSELFGYDIRRHFSRIGTITEFEQWIAGLAGRPSASWGREGRRPTKP